MDPGSASGGSSEESDEDSDETTLGKEAAGAEHKHVCLSIDYEDARVARFH